MLCSLCFWLNAVRLFLPLALFNFYLGFRDLSLLQNFGFLFGLFMLLRGIKGFFKVRNGGKGDNRKASSSNSTFLCLLLLYCSWLRMKLRVFFSFIEFLDAWCSQIWRLGFFLLNCLVQNGWWLYLICLMTFPSFFF